MRNNKTGSGTGTAKARPGQARRDRLGSGPKLSLSIVKLGHPKAANRHNRVASSDDIFVIYDQVAKALSLQWERRMCRLQTYHTHCTHHTHTHQGQATVCASCQALRLSVSLSVIVFLMEGTPNIDRT